MVPTQPTTTSTGGTVGNILGMVPAIGGVIQGIYGMFTKGADQARYDAQQKAAQDQQYWLEQAGADAQAKRNLQMWKDTNAPAQVQEYKDAGLNPALMYGQGGGGGVTANAGSAPAISMTQPINPNQSRQMDIATMNQIAQMGLIKAQTENVEAQTENTKVDTAKTAGVDTEKVVADTTKAGQDVNESKTRQEGLMINNAINKITQVDQEDTINANARIAKTASAKQMADYDAWKAANFGQITTDDENSPLAGAYKAGLEQVTQNLKNAISTGKQIDADTAIKQFDATMTASGITKDSPWYVKTLTDWLTKLGLNPMAK